MIEVDEYKQDKKKTLLLENEEEEARKRKTGQGKTEEKIKRRKKSGNSLKNLGFWGFGVHQSSKSKRKKKNKKAFSLTRSIGIDYHISCNKLYI